MKIIFIIFVSNIRLKRQKTRQCETNFTLILVLVSWLSVSVAALWSDNFLELTIFIPRLSPPLTQIRFMFQIIKGMSPNVVVSQQSAEYDLLKLTLENQNIFLSLILELMNLQKKRDPCPCCEGAWSVFTRNNNQNYWY